jgi:homoserine kinase type II
MKLTNNQLKKIFSKWDLGEVKEIKKAEKGVVNHNWIVKTDKGKYVFRGLSKYKKLKNLEFELKYLDSLNKAGFEYEIPKAISDRKGKKLIKVGENYVFVYGFIEGNVKKTFGKKEIKEMAKMTANYHKILEKSNINSGKGKCKPYLKDLILNEIKEYKKDISKLRIQKKEGKIFLKEVGKLLPIFDELDEEGYGKLKQYSIHSDMNPENVIWKGNKLTGVIDFENVPGLTEPLIKDIAIILQIGCSKDGGTLKIRKAKYFIKEYRKHRKLTNQEIKILPDIIAATYVDDFNYAYLMLDRDPERAKLYRLKKYSKAAQWYWKNREKIVKELLE